MLWIQEKVEGEDILIKKVKGVSNPADMMIKCMSKEKLNKYMVMTKQKVSESRAQEALQMQRRKYEQEMVEGMGIESIDSYGKSEGRDRTENSSWKQDQTRRQG